MTSPCWTSFTDPKTLINVGMEVVGMQCHNMICFTELKTNTKTFFKADDPSVGAGILLIAGHTRFPLFAFVEAILRPSIHIMKYPSFKDFVVLTSPTTTTYVDIRFSEFDYFVALGGFPKYMFRIWNYRTGQLITEYSTYKRCGSPGLLCSIDNIPTVIQYSKWQKEVTVWELCFQQNKVYFNEVTKLPLSKDYYETSMFSMCFADDGNFYICNDYGNVSSIELGQFHMKNQWSVPGPTSTMASTITGILPKPRRHGLYSFKQGLVVSDGNTLHYIKKRGIVWQIEWIMEDMSVRIAKMIVSCNELHAVDHLGNLYRIDMTKDSVALNGLDVTHTVVADYVLVKGIKEEPILVLTDTGDLRLADMLRNNPYSTLRIKNGITLAAHYCYAYVAVGTKNGQIHWINYERARAPVIAGMVTIEDNIIADTCLLDAYSFVRDAFNGFHIMHSDFKKNKFQLIASLDHESQKSINVVQSFAVEENCALVFISYDITELMLYATELWLYEWLPQRAEVTTKKFELPFKYRDFALASGNRQDVIEVVGVRNNDTVIDVLHVVKKSTLVLDMSIATKHFSNLNGIIGTRNMVTWGMDGVLFHFKSHKKSSRSFMISRLMQMSYWPRMIKRAEECFNGKYLVFFYGDGGIIKVFKIAQQESLRENTLLPADSKQIIPPSSVQTIELLEARKLLEKVEVQPEHLIKREELVEQIKDLSGKVTELIDYDISVTGKTHGIFRKFCLNYKWLRMLMDQATILCNIERSSLLDSIADQTRIRQWILSLIQSTCSDIAIKVRAIFSNSSVENYAKRQSIKDITQQYDYYRLYDMEPFEEEEANADEEEPEEELDEAAGGVERAGKPRKIYVVRGKSVYDHVMSSEFFVQDKNIVTSNQMHNSSAKFKILINDVLKAEFNKKFVEVQKLKQEIMDNIVATNATLTKIYANMNCMLCLLKMETFVPEALTVPVWMKDEVLERIMLVDDSEIKAINRRKAKQLVSAHKGGRMLLWSVEFWVRALNVMMDGVLEKLWEEEIKKEIPMPEFMLKKQVHEFTLEDQKQLREYENKLKLLADDRRKYLRILKENEDKTMLQKKNYILKLNEKCAEMAITKLKYDFAVKHCRIRLMNIKQTHYDRMQWRRRMFILRADLEKMTEYIAKYVKLSDFWEKSVSDIKSKLEVQQSRDKAVERQYKGQFLNSIPGHLAHEMNKLFKRRPKMMQRSFTSPLVCMEIASRVVQRHSRSLFPLPNEIIDYINALDALDEVHNCPNQLDTKHWDPFVKLRRQKIESELRMKGIGYQLVDAQNRMNKFVKDVANLKLTKMESLDLLDSSVSEYLKSIHNQRLQITLNMGQVEISLIGAMANTKHSILMNLDDVNEVNNLIKEAGAKKLKAMQRVAYFRRQVIYKEWEHKMFRANINYLQYMVQVIEKCSVTYEFLTIIRNWAKVKDAKEKTNRVGIIERVIAEKIAAFRKNLERINDKIDICKKAIDDTKQRNQQVNRQIDEVKICLAIATVNRDTMVEEKRTREQEERMSKIKAHSNLMDKVRRDYAHILELSTILELQRLRTYPTLGPAPPDCI